MAGSVSAAIHRRPLLRTAIGTYGRPRLARLGARRRAGDSGHYFSSSRKLAPEPLLGLFSDGGRDSIGRHFACITDLSPSRTQGSAGPVVRLGECPLDL